MAGPTEPGYYWVRHNHWKEGQEWSIVEVGEDIACKGLVYYHTGCEYPFSLDSIGDNDWGGRITQEPVVDPPPPF